MPSKTDKSSNPTDEESAKQIRRKSNEKPIESHHAGEPLSVTCRRKEFSRKTPKLRSPFGWTYPNSSPSPPQNTRRRTRFGTRLSRCSLKSFIIIPPPQLQFHLLPNYRNTIWLILKSANHHLGFLSTSLLKLECPKGIESDFHYIAFCS